MPVARLKRSPGFYQEGNFGRNPTEKERKQSWFELKFSPEDVDAALMAAGPTGLITKAQALKSVARPLARRWKKKRAQVPKRKGPGETVSEEILSKMGQRHKDIIKEVATIPKEWLKSITGIQASKSISGLGRHEYGVEEGKRVSRILFNPEKVEKGVIPHEVGHGQFAKERMQLGVHHPAQVLEKLAKTKDEIIREAGLPKIKGLYNVDPEETIMRSVETHVAKYASPKFSEATNKAIYDRALAKATDKVMKELPKITGVGNAILESHIMKGRSPLPGYLRYKLDKL